MNILFIFVFIITIYQVNVHIFNMIQNNMTISWLVQPAKPSLGRPLFSVFLSLFCGR